VSKMLSEINRIYTNTQTILAFILRNTGTNHVFWVPDRFTEQLTKKCLYTDKCCSSICRPNLRHFKMFD
jgi:hypothetical protein